jgi:hypothetical protein
LLGVAWLALVRTSERSIFEASKKKTLAQPNTVRGFLVGWVFDL